MKCLLLRGLSALLVLTIATPALAAEKTSRADAGACEAIPLSSPTGGGSRERLEAIRRCNLEVMVQQQQAMMAEMQVMMSQMKAMMAQMKGATSSERQTSRTSALTDSNPPAEIPSPYLQTLEQQQQALIAEMQMMMSRMKAMMDQMRKITGEPQSPRSSTLTNPLAAVPKVKSTYPNQAGFIAVESF